MTIIHSAKQKIFIVKENSCYTEAVKLLDIGSQMAQIKGTEQESQLINSALEPANSDEVGSAPHHGLDTPPPQIAPVADKKVQQQQLEESTQDTSSNVPPEPELFFQAVGLVRGQYLPSTEDLGKGILLLNDGAIAPTKLLASAAYVVEKHPSLLESSQVWIVYPRVKPQPPCLQFAIRGVRNPLQGEDSEVIEQSVDDFTIRGIVTYQDSKAGKFVVRVYRNFMPWKKQEGTKYKPHIFTITGVLPSSSPAYGQFWNLKLKRVSDQLVLQDATFVTQVLTPKKQKKQR